MVHWKGEDPHHYKIYMTKITIKMFFNTCKCSSLIRNFTPKIWIPECRGLINGTMTQTYPRHLRKTRRRRRRARMSQIRTNLEKPWWTSNGWKNFGRKLARHKNIYDLRSFCDSFKLKYVIDLTLTESNLFN